MTIKENFTDINERISKTALACGRTSATITLIAVSKRKSSEMIEKCIKAGATHFGENYIQEAMEKIERIGKDRATWHFIGHLQSNKAKYAVKYFDYIHTVDTVKLAREINKQAQKNGKVQNILIQVNIGDEKTKSGTGKEDATALIEQIRGFENISVKGLMCMPPFSIDAEEARHYFKALVRIKEMIQAKNFNTISMEHLSMGMSNDFKVAIEEGSTMVRVGTSIFGRRE